MGRNRSKQDRRAEQWEKERKRINWDVVWKVLASVFAFAGSMVAVYELVNYFRSDAKTFYSIIFPGLGIIVLTVILVQLVRKKNPYAILLLSVTILGGVVGGIRWHSQVETIDKKLVVLVALFDGPDETYGLRSQVMEELHKTAKEYDNVVVIDGKESITAGQGSEYARRLGEAESADIVIWGWYRPIENPNITIHIENLSPENSLPINESETIQPITTLAELKSFSFQQQAGQEAGSLISFLAGYIDFKNQNYKSALERFDNAISNLPTTPQLLENQAEIYFYRAITNFELKEYQRAIQDYDRAIQLDSNNMAGYFNRGLAYFFLGAYQHAIQDYSQAAQLDTQDASIYINRGVAYDLINEHQRAIQDYDHAIRLDPQIDTAYNNRGLNYVTSGEYQRAIQDFDQAIQLNPQYVNAYNSRGIAYGDLGDYQRAIQDFDQAIRLNPQYVTAYHNRGNAYVVLGKYKRAIQDYDHAIQINPQLSEVYRARGLAYAHLREYQRAIQDYNQAVQLNPRDVDTYNSRGIAYGNLGEYELAIQDYDKAIELDPQFALAYFNRGAAHQRLNKTAEAEADFKKYEELTGEKPPSHPSP